ncbi:helix-turn-helix domain-containing protein [Luteimicrobium subarcticum]|uniref:NB-ARC domain-containing protein n=1 Tax=Luteimicrobium subarcticum TaxID=620910 RepID=A0A2M8WJM2_9MICO|nr:helix-turn-helix domain-containing protein [Luteimicrobium subarcticum]PJI91130.1 NB-ARC domain-containing protein [Luteimicrobium subarcticum]
MTTSLGSLLRGYRLAADMTLEALAAASGVSDRAIGDIERGTSRGPQHRTVCALADALGLAGTDRDALVLAARTGRRRDARPPLHTLPLPRPVGDFVGRAAEREQVGALLRAAAPGAASPVVLVSGPPGFGKSTLAVQVAVDLGGDFDDVLFLDLRGLDREPLAPATVVRRVLEAVGPDGGPTVGPREAPAALRAALAGRRVLLVLDNAASEDQVRAVVPSAGPAAVLVTSRRSLGGLEDVRRFALERLGVDDAVGLLGAMLPDRDDERDDLVRLAELCDAVPLALRIAGNRLATRAGWPVSGLVARLAVEERRLDTLVAGDLGVAAAFRSSFEQLGPGAQQLFRRLAVIEAPTVGAALAAVLVGGSRWRAEDLLDELVDLSLLQHVAGDRFQLHDLLRLFADHELRAQEDAESARAVGVAADRWLLASAVRAGRYFEPEHQDTVDPGDGLLDLDGTPDAMAWLKAESVSWLAALRRAARSGDHRRVVEVADSLHWFSDLWAVWVSWAEVFELSAQSARQLGDDALVAVHEGYLAWAQMECLDDSDAAFASALRAVEAAERAADEAKAGWASAYLAWIATRRDDLAVAEVHAEAAVRWLRAAGDREGYPQALVALGNVRAKLGRIDDAIALMRQVIEVATDERTRPRAQVALFTEASGYANLAGYLGQAERWEEMLEVATTAVEVSERLGAARIRSNAYLSRGTALRMLGRNAEAVAVLAVSLEIRQGVPGDAARARVQHALEDATAGLPCDPAGPA